MKLTNTACKNVKSQSKQVKMFDGGGLFLLVHPNGSKYWRLKYRFNGKEKLLALGVYPLVSLAEAREKRDEAKRLVALGLDPSEEARKKKKDQEIAYNNSFQAVALEWHGLKSSSWTDNHAGYTLRRLEANVFPEFGSRPVSDIEPREVLETLRKIEDRGAHEMAARVRSICSQIFRYAIVTSRADRDPCQDLQGALKPYKKSHYAAIDASELPEFLVRLNANDARLYKHTQLAVKMLMLTFVRTSELIQAKWEEFDLENAVWTIPASRMKMGKEHVVPLSKQVLDILKELKQISPKSEYVFPSQVGHKKHMSNNTVLKALERMGYKGKMTGHGFRSLAMTIAKEKLGYRHEVIDRQLAHLPQSSVDRAYDRARFLDERTEMMQKIADYVDRVAE